MAEVFAGMLCMKLKRFMLLISSQNKRMCSENSLHLCFQVKLYLGNLEQFKSTENCLMIKF
jgi:hypothetical protein